ncbi:MAG: hypothetical protein II921_10050, partial [Treponema sp.]|nr:hypothetical protein [Treponema sp.]
MFSDSGVFGSRYFHAVFVKVLGGNIKVVAPHHGKMVGFCLHIAFALFMSTKIATRCQFKTTSPMSFPMRDLSSC